MPPPAEIAASRLFIGPALRTQPDHRLVALVRGGYESAFEEIVRRYGRPLTRYASAIVGSRGEDVTQDAFSKALLALRRSDAEIELRSWLFRIVRNAALNDLRDSPPTPELPAEAIAGGASPSEVLERRAELTDLTRRLHSLPEAQRAAIVMRELEGLSHEEIATALGVSGGAARQAIHRARRTLRDRAGMLIPLPLLKTLLAAGSMGTAEVAAGAGGTVGAGVALKAVTASVLVAGAVGAGVAIRDGRQAVSHLQQVAVTNRAPRDGVVIPSGSLAATAPTRGDERTRHEGDDRGRGNDERGGDRGRGKDKNGDDRGGLGGDRASGGPGSGSDHESRADTDGHGGAVGSGRGGGRQGSLSGGGGDSGGGGSGESGGRDSSGSGHDGESSADGADSSDRSGGGDPSDGLAGGGSGPNVSPTSAESSSGSGGGDGGSGEGSSSSGSSGPGSGSSDYLSVD
jgi:RNA polymerase sigma factor (sigma-70 family)